MPSKINWLYFDDVNENDVIKDENKKILSIYRDNHTNFHHLCRVHNSTTVNTERYHEVNFTFDTLFIDILWYKIIILSIFPIFPRYTPFFVFFLYSGIIKNMDNGQLNNLNLDNFIYSESLLPLVYREFVFDYKFEVLGIQKGYYEEVVSFLYIGLSNVYNLSVQQEGLKFYLKYKGYRKETLLILPLVYSFFGLSILWLFFCFTPTKV